jgi:hypothetical protein
MQDDYLKYIVTVGESLRGFSKWTEIYEQQINAIQLATSLQPMIDVTARYRNVIDSLVPRHMEMLQGLELPWNREMLNGTLTLQMEAISSALQCVQTDAITNLLKDFKQANWMSGMEQFMSSLETSFTPVANFAFLCNIDGLDDLLENGYPSGMKTFIRSVHKRTAMRMAQNNQVEVNCKDKIFRPMHNANCEIKVTTMNIISSSTELFEVLKEEELMGFIDVLANEYAFASEHPVGRKIWEIIRDWNKFMDFDKEYYYHGRAKKENGFIYTSDEMGKAPNEYITFGRFNHMKQSHYYFADSEQGAKAEINIHNRGAEVQVARLRPKRSIRMIDLSEEVKTKNKFLECLRYTASKSIKPTEYLLPEFVTTCCKKAGIEGVKYYGSKEYKNYVCWDDGYFDVDIIW